LILSAIGMRIRNEDIVAVMQLVIGGWHELSESDEMQSLNVY
jgi:hypothetical protein